jgi:hypothetical protein
MEPMRTEHVCSHIKPQLGLPKRLNMKEMHLDSWMLLLLVISASGNCVSPVSAADVTHSQSSVTETTTVTGDPTIIQHIDSKMQPTVVQSRVSTDPATGEKQNVVEPLIMERKEKVLDTTIIQPQMTETKTTTQEATQSTGTQSLSPPKPAAVRAHALRRLSHRHHTGTHVAKSPTPPSQIVSNNKEVVQTTEIVRQPTIKETFIKAPPDNTPPESPQVIQKSETK